MAQHPFLKSIRPVNLLSFGPNTEEIELRPLNILIGPNGSGKSNLIEIFGLLSKLPDKDPWSTVVQTGGAPEWIWKGKGIGEKEPSLSVTAAADFLIAAHLLSNPGFIGENLLSYSIVLRERSGELLVTSESFREISRSEEGRISEVNVFERTGRTGLVHTEGLEDSPVQLADLRPDRSVFSMPESMASITFHHISAFHFAKQVERFSFYRDWVFGSGSKTRALQPSGFDSYRLAADSINLAQVLKAMRDRGDQSVFDRLLDLLRKFYEPVKDVDTELLGTYLRIMVKEEGLSSRTPAERLSDGTLRWLMLLIVLLDPAPPPVICIDEPELGLHPDIIPTLADLLRDASKRTQLILTTHSRTLVECFSDDPESVCVCEKFNGATEIRRLEADRMKIWLEEYSLGQLWSSGEIGGNRW
ncbi:MAG TPA: AAA family ATPase [Terracidiphilus sp.]|nr:AAA family ATPase [Terracidiphilus sp.]